MTVRRKLSFLLLGLALSVAALAAVVALLNVRGEAPIVNRVAPLASPPEQIVRGRYLALAGNCAGCHTVPGGQAYAGGRGIETPFGTVYASNLTPDPETGIGDWSADHFWRAMHNGRSRDGRLLYPAFPYTSYTQITREDSDAIYAWLRSLAPVARANQPHALGFPYNSQAALAVWRALYFRPGTFEPQPERSAQWNRGAYLVGGLGHCIACHGGRNILGATDSERELSGNALPGEHWYAPALDSSAEAGVADWSASEVVALLKTGVAERASVSGPMAEVVYSSTQYLGDADLAAMASYLRALPDRAPGPAPAASHARSGALMARGEERYVRDCASCHGDAGEGKPGMIPALAGNRAVQLENPANLLQVLRFGGYAPTTAGNPRPWGMPPFGHLFSDEDIAAVLTYVRGSWGNNAPEVSLFQVVKRR